MKTLFFAIMLISCMAITQSKPVATPPVVDPGHIEMPAWDKINFYGGSISIHS
jgi:hypothetical protein